MRSTAENQVTQYSAVLGADTVAKSVHADDAFASYSALNPFVVDGQTSAALLPTAEYRSDTCGRAATPPSAGKRTAYALDTGGHKITLRRYESREQAWVVGPPSPGALKSMSLWHERCGLHEQLIRKKVFTVSLD